MPRYTEVAATLCEAAAIRDFLTTCRDNDVDVGYVADRKLAAEFKARHLRAGRLSREDSREGLGVAVWAFGYDELGNCVALCRDGHVRQFIG